ncbi:serine protease inhibitor I/II-like [Ruditapes philippinarum]|uniref:serine protease inhibitor I/II-like n=1 Tax=Ruditapes philippinarum TaxID=129788 RepID=UPI00295A91E2|nr:serine protease inhibitor I/II-like [Ruditapes philippinarum]
MRQFVICALLIVLAVAYVQSECVHNGITYKTGEQYQDDCNKCTCSGNGGGACTRRECPPKVCTYNGGSYGDGEQFMDADNCNQCTCTATGVAACTLMLCG